MINAETEMSKNQIFHLGPSKKKVFHDLQRASLPIFLLKLYLKKTTIPNVLSDLKYMGITTKSTRISLYLTKLEEKPQFQARFQSQARTPPL